MRPLVGISLRAHPGGGDRRARLALDPAYAEAATEAGALAVHLGWPADPAALAARLDALVIPGGPDFLAPFLMPAMPAPPEEAAWPGPPREASVTPPGPEAAAPPGPSRRRALQPRSQPGFDPVDSCQLAFDRALLAAALARGIPVLGICYGMQLLALHAGGRLHLHLPRDLPRAGSHRARGSRDARHGLHVAPGTLLARVLGAGDMEVNSSHHQAVSDPGAWRVAARAPDGVVEAVEPPGAGPERFWLGVQWHPERMDSDHRRALFGALVEAARLGAAGQPAPRARA